MDATTLNKNLANQLNLIAEHYDIDGDTYRANTFKNAGLIVSKYPTKITTGAELTKIKGIGKSTKEAVDEFLQTGKIKRLEELQYKHSNRDLTNNNAPVDNAKKDVIDFFMTIHGVGAVTAARFYDLGFRSLDDLKEKATLTEAQRIGIDWYYDINERISRQELDMINYAIDSILSPYNITWEIAGSYRRLEDSSGDIDLLVESRPDLNMSGLLTLLSDHIPENSKLAEGATKYMGIFVLSNQYKGHRIDIRIVDEPAYPFALMYFTGSQNFNILMRNRAIELGYTLNEYRLTDMNTNQHILARSESEIFDKLKVVYLSPVERTRDLTHLNFL